jgi:NADPH2:quinone reductase
MMKLRNKAGGFSWQGMFTRSNWQTADMVKQGLILDRVAELIDSGELRTTQTRDFGAMSPATLMQAHQAIQAGTMIGKGTLYWSDQ